MKREREKQVQSTLKTVPRWKLLLPDQQLKQESNLEACPRYLVDNYEILVDHSLTGASHISLAKTSSGCTDPSSIRVPPARPL